MNKKLYWGLLALIILLGTAFVVIMLHDRAEIRKLKEELADVKEQEKHVPQQADVGNRPPRDARAGHKWEWHGDHWHEMPIAQNDVPNQTQASDEIVFEPFELKSNLPDELPIEFPTDAELQKMNAIDIHHLMDLYTREADAIHETNKDAGIRFYNATVPKLWARLLVMDEEDNARREERNRKSKASAGFYPATEGSPAMTLTVSPFEDSDN